MVPGKKLHCHAFFCLLLPVPPPMTFSSSFLALIIPLLAVLTRVDVDAVEARRRLDRMGASAQEHASVGVSELSASLLLAAFSLWLQPMPAVDPRHHTNRDGANANLRIHGRDCPPQASAADARDGSAGFDIAELSRRLEQHVARRQAQLDELVPSWQDLGQLVPSS